MTEQVDASGAGALLGESVLQRLREEIITGALPPGTALSVPGIAARYGVSRSPVREAVQQLTVEGVAEYRPRAGARVAEMDAATLGQVFELHQILDAQASEQATRNATSAQIAALRALVEVQESNLGAPPDPVRDLRVNLEFHTRLREASGNRPLCDVLERLDVQSFLYPTTAWSDPWNVSMAVREHRAIVDALEIGDARGAASAAASHAGAVFIRIIRT
ncbi:MULTISPECIES: GntR family transcriptional regulator [unclassified Corynebacterium]|uniref:GntR family transcriptional regulator n=1 Tax=unclassified Corynebacterium TaxID=2624378 RepID=UPI0026481753|nr:GntR family transcriptional regulator [Corynebacterium sp.]MDN5721127.1 GntR family transcriptional regulator [Corynebacterium sp.]